MRDHRMPPRATAAETRTLRALLRSLPALVALLQHVAQGTDPELHSHRARLLLRELEQ